MENANILQTATGEQQAPINNQIGAVSAQFNRAGLRMEYRG